MTTQNSQVPHVCRHRRDLLLGGSLAGVALAFPQLAAAGKLLGVASEVYVNGKRAYRGTRIKPGDVVKTGGLSEALFVVGKDAFMLRQNSEMRLLTSQTSRAIAAGLRVLTGGLLAVFAPGSRKVVTSTVTAGIRGTGIYVEVNPQSTYFCTCYGQVDLAHSDGAESRQVSATHHNGYIVHAQSQPAGLFEPAEMRNHYDEELELLERMVGRIPPFMPG